MQNIKTPPMGLDKDTRDILLALKENVEEILGLRRSSTSASLASLQTQIDTLKGQLTGKTATSSSETEPADPNTNDLWYNPNTKIFQRWNGRSWEEVANNYSSLDEIGDGEARKAVAEVTPTGLARVDLSETEHINKNADHVEESEANKWAAEHGATVGAVAGTNLFDSLGSVLTDEKVITGRFTTGPPGTNRIIIYDHETDGYIAGVDSSDEIQAQLRASDGKFIAGGGDVVLDNAGITVMMASAWAAKNSYKMLSGGVRRCEWYALDDGSVIDMFLFANGGSDRDARIVINASPTTADHEGTLTISASKLGAQSAVTLTTESIRISTPGSVDVGSASTGFHFDASSRIVLGGAPSSMSATNIMTVRNGTPPPTNVTDAFTMYSDDQVAGNACPHFRCEDGAIIKLYKQLAMTPDNGHTFVAGNFAGAGAADASAQSNNMNARIGQLENALKLLGIKP
jgi:hypothetical protein